MKHSLLIFALALSMLAGCQNSTTNDIPLTTQATTPGTSATVPLSTQAQPTFAATLTPAEAEALALAHAGFTAGEVTGLRSEYEIDDGVPHYDVRFRKGLVEYEYEIHAQTGSVLSFDKDD